MSLTLIVFIIAVFVFIAIALSGVEKTGSGSPDYAKIGPLFTPAERSFLGVLEQAVSNNYRIYGKVRVADVLKTKATKQRSSWQTAFNKIAAKHFDFVLCNMSTMEVICVIELDDKSHNSKRAQDRDLFLNNACQGADLKLVRFKAQKSYQIEAVRNAIIEATNSLSVSEDVGTPTCNKLELINSERLTSSKLAKKHGLKTSEFLDKMVEYGYLTEINGTHQLTEKGLRNGGEFIEKGRYPAHFKWIEENVPLFKMK
ncbi:DUF2726 domain-containing protein [Pseudoalteromonas sp. SCQQ13]|uniref:DUF2726 domain-containing protein n=1 Tax=Pseudoalteromonas sp. SCQQ13 TaxID=2792066 RepID=UPI0018CEB8F7|nr:DUF2726 domain-containing protein [Pseudoalteromonas sp. SCQQ13]MBH0094574.1 DUF2726 domain-containing protein [Pseudoalteromonas sp. SCQQ13]